MKDRQKVGIVLRSSTDCVLSLLVNGNSLLFSDNGTGWGRRSELDMCIPEVGHVSLAPIKRQQMK